MEAAVAHGTKPDCYNPEVHEDTDVSEELFIKDDDNIFVGNNFDVCVKLENKSSDDRTINLSVIVQSCYYTGRRDQVVKDVL